ncbi:MAG: hypothetical protein DRN14_00125 [Thermoplasmata archaeon]|nr:MAG: hypothetical protein DRN14_00125 [Thermoplasmata archaeon]
MSLTLKQKIEEIDEVVHLIGNDWEVDFIKSMKKKITYSHCSDEDFSHRQASKINALYEKACNSSY